MYSAITLLGAAALIAASTAHAQAPELALLSRIPTGHSTAGTFSAAGTARGHAAPILDITGERALLGQVDNPARPTDRADFSREPIDGTRALLGKWPSAISIGPGGRAGAGRRAAIESRTGGTERTRSWPR